MRSQNHQEVSKAYRQFSGYLVMGVAIAVLSFLFYTHTAQIEVDRIVTKTDEYDKIYARQTGIIHQIDSLYNQIRDFNPGVNSSYAESDIKFYLNDLKGLYNRNSHDSRCKIFLQISNFYGMWFDDRKEMWSKQKNIKVFKKNLEECETGLQKKSDELRNSQ